jgi:hypothetical protein|tara:strand:- start:3125 stop:3415 length:291 start_codon:yes stop_codon:yes gene_type:complete
MVSIPGMFEENVQYELTPGDNDHWHIRIKEGEFVESIISFGEIVFNNTTDMMNFNITLHSSPDDELTVDNTELQRYAGKILESVLMGNLDEMENSK